MNALRGWLAALGSVLLASAAQLGMRWGMSACRCRKPGPGKRRSAPRCSR